jgi:predicted ArsR family transcriptional regulator
MHRLDSIGDRDLRETLLFARAQALPVTADEVARAQGVHRNVARGRLERLVAAGLLVASFERRTGRTGPGAGRPAKTYRVAPELTALEFPERRYERLIGLVAGALPARGRRRRLRELGSAFGRELVRASRLRPARTLATAVNRVCAALGELGYHAIVAEADGESAVVTTPTCPLRPLVRAHPALADLDRGMWAGLLGRALAGTGVDQIACETADCLRDDQDCRVRLTVRRSNPRRPRSA